MRITTTRPLVTAAAVTAVAALLTAGCGFGGDGTTGGAKPAASSSDGSSSAPNSGMKDAGGDDMMQDGDDHMMAPDDVNKAKPEPMMGTKPTESSEMKNDKKMAPDMDRAKPGKVGPMSPASTGGVASAPRAAVSKKRPPVHRNPRVGRLIGILPHNRVLFCSATVVPNKGRNLIVTAAHCLYDEKTGELNTDKFEFIPGYYAKGKKGYAPYGVYTAERWWVNKAWVHKHDNRVDFAFMRLRPGSHGFRGAGKNVASVVGAMGIAWNQGPRHTILSYGYDAEDRFGWDNGCCAYVRKGRSIYYRAAGQLLVQHHFITGGASGGPWITNYNAKRRIGFVNGVNSRSDRSTLFTSSYFGSALENLYHKAA